MYLPQHFAMTDEQARDVVRRHGAGELVTATPDGPRATILPFVYDETLGEHGTLLGHVARANDHWQQPVLGEALVLLRGGPDAYVSPGWYPSKAEHGRVVPTWDYTSVHAYGPLVVHDDPEWLADVVGRLTDRHEAGRAAPWAASDAPEAFFRGQLRAIVGVEVRLTRLVGKAKLSQNRPAADVDGVVAGLSADGHAGLAAQVEAARRR